MKEDGVYRAEVICYTEGVAIGTGKGKEGGGYMPMTEKELNCTLFDQLSLLDDIEEAAIQDNAKSALKVIEKKRAQINRKLYQKPPLAD